MMYALLVALIIWQVYLTFLVIKIKSKKDEEISKNETDFSIGLVKFNPFEGVGSNQSFCMALLSSKDSGIIFTSLHGRNGTRVYAREVNVSKWQSEKLSNEEKEAIKKALAVTKSK